MPLPLLPLFGVAKLAGGFIAQYWKPLAIVAIVVAVLAIAYGRGRSDAIAVWKPRLEALQAAHAAASALAMQQREAEKAQHVTERDAIVAHLQERLHAKDDALAAALERVRGATRVRALAPASAAPAPCRDYEAGPEQLSEPHREFLVRLGAEADGVAEQLGACQKYAISLHQTCSAPEVQQ